MRLTKEQILEQMPSLNPDKDLVAMWYGDIPGRTYDVTWHEEWKKLTGTLSNISATKAFMYEVYGEFDTYSTFIGDAHVSRDGKVLAGDVRVKYRGDTYDIYLNEMYGWHALDIMRIGQTVTGFSNEDGMGSPSLNTKEMSADVIEAVINQPLEDYGYGIQRLMEMVRATYYADPTNYIMEKLKSYGR